MEQIPKYAIQARMKEENPYPWFDVAWTISFLDAENVRDRFAELDGEYFIYRVTEHD